MDIQADTKARIFSVADQLFKDAGSDRFPTVDQVRRAAKCDMNTASGAMREWRRGQTAQPEKTIVALPSELSEKFLALAQDTYETAQKIANESLDAAKTKWEAERQEAEAMRVEIAEAFEIQGRELETAQAQKTELAEELETQSVERSKLETQSAEQALKIEALTAQVADLKTGLADYHRKLEQSRADQQSAAQAAEIAQAKEAAAVEKADDQKASVTELKAELAEARIAAAAALKEAADTGRKVQDAQKSIINLQEQGRADTEKHQAQLTAEHEKNRQLAAELADAREALAKAEATAKPAPKKTVAKKTTTKNEGEA
jgi:chromosome segregation ATPase